MSEEAMEGWLEAAKRAQEELPPLTEGGIGPGDLVVLGNAPAAAQPKAAGIEWALIDKDPAAPEKYLAVPADGSSLRGSGDLAIGRGGELRTLRCRHPLWLVQDAESRWRKTGKLTPTELARTRRLLQQIAAGGEIGGLLAREVDESPDYQEDIAGPLAVRVATLRKEGKAKAPPPPRSISGGLRAWAVAATLLVGLLGFTVAQELARVATLREEQRRTEAEHSREVQALAAEKENLDQEKRRAEEQAAATSATLESTRQDLEQARKESVIANPELTILTRPGSTRGPVKVELDPNASHLLVLIPIESANRKERYRLELVGGKAPWTSPDLEVLSPGELRIGIPSSLLPDGPIRLSLKNKTGHRVAEYEIRIRFNPPLH